MFSSVVNVRPFSQLLRLVFVMAVAVASLLANRSALSAAELLMLEQPGCVWCKRFNEEIAPAYAKTDEGRRAPLRRVDITEDWPVDLEGIRPERLTPTFILLDKGVEIERMIGYPGNEFFWGLLDDMLSKLPAADTAAAN